jgi:4-amino-4-deoxy-L-arabinose transferase-like glycosyltransferase
MALSANVKRVMPPGPAVLISVFVALFLGTTALSLSPYIGDDILIGHADDANLANLARNITEGKGAVVDNVWILTNGGMDDPSIPHPEPYWSVYLAVLLSGFFKLFGSTRLILLIPAILAKTGIVALSLWWTARMSKNNIYAMLATVVLLFLSPQMLTTISGKSDIYLTLCILSAGTSLCFAIAKNKKALFVLAGVITGIGIAFKPSGLLFLGLLIPYLIFFPAKKTVLLNISIFSISTLISLFPLAIYNISSFGTILSAGSPLVKEAHDTTLMTMDYNRAFYNPEPFVMPEGEKKPSFAEKSLIYFRWALSNESKRGVIMPLWLAPFFFAGGLLFFSGLKKGGGFRNDPNALFIAFSMLMFIGGLVLATQIVPESRYWHFLFPLLVIISVWVMAKLHPYLLAFPVLVAIVSGISWYGSAPEPKKIPRVYERVMAQLPKDAIVFTSDPWEFSFHTRLGSVMLPYTDDDSTLLAVAEKYNVEYIVIVNRVIRHPKYQPLLEGIFPEYLEPVLSGNYLTILKFR